MAKKAPYVNPGVPRRSRQRTGGDSPIAGQNRGGSSWREIRQAV